MREDRDVTVIESESGSGFKWFLLGAALGAGLGLLLAPQSGERTRRDLVKRGKKLRAKATERFEDISDEIQSRGRKIKETVEEFAEGMMEEVDEEVGEEEEEEAVQVGKRSAPTAREEMERRLADARARARAAIGADGVSEDDDEVG